MPRATAIAWRSGLESSVGDALTKQGVPFAYEKLRIPYTRPASEHVYTPDFVLSNGIVVETKGLWDLEDRKKHKLLKEQYPDIDLRIVFQRSSSPISKGSKTTYAAACTKMGITFADKSIPQSWLEDPPNIGRVTALGATMPLLFPQG